VLLIIILNIKATFRPLC